MRSAPAGQALRQLAAALAADPGALARGAPPVAGRLAAELIARGSATLTLPACARCGRAGMPLYRTRRRGHVQAVHRPPGSRRPARTAARSSRSSAATPPGSGSANGAAAMTADTAGAGYAARPPRSPCAARGGSAGHLRQLLPDARAPSAARAASTGNATSPAAAIRSARRARPGPPRAAPAAARTARRGPLARGPGLRPVLHRRAAPPRAVRLAAASCGGWWPRLAPRRPPALPAPGSPVMRVCADCGIEDKLYEKGRCARCSLRRRAAALLSGGNGQVPGELAAVLRRSARHAHPRAALNWLRSRGGRRHPRRPRRRPARRHSRGARSAPTAAGRRLPAADAHRRRGPAAPR